ncbi:Conserved_hypothetical protein [Hexamita inflata]|uniref:Uncharacterized protein n=1 Tax=Hexamita inflata TaxID=28002 RepID=A0AA86UUE3_9EUKA|nr:Conserved hypothetical protein [Hexamita inflata]CAI9972175.1 Conserved hypothetical protein [Hexamita inflata]
MLLQYSVNVPPQQNITCLNSVLVQDKNIIFCARNHAQGTYRYGLTASGPFTFFINVFRLEKTKFEFNIVSNTNFQLSNAISIQITDCSITIKYPKSECVLGENTVSVVIYNSQIIYKNIIKGYFVLQGQLTINNSQIFIKIITDQPSSFGLVKNLNQNLKIENSNYQIHILTDQGAIGALCSEYIKGTVYLANSNINGTFNSNQINGMLVGIAHTQLLIQFDKFNYCISGNAKLICGSGNCSFLITTQNFPSCSCLSYKSSFSNCECPASYRDTGSSCLQCQLGSILNANNQCDCGNNQQYDGTACVQCPYYKNIFNGICSCPYNHQDNMVACLTCFGYPLINGKCMCDINEMYTGTQCILCPNYKYPLNEQCLCQPGYSDNGLNCVICPTDSIANLNQASCSCKDPLKSYIPSNNDCECPINYRINGNSCSLCPIITTTNGLLNQLTCTCNELYKDYVIQNETCVCKVNSIIFGITCKACPNNANTNGLQDQTICQCNDALMQYYISDNLCKCNINTYIQGSTCLQCPSSSSTNGLIAQTQCVCTDPLMTHDIINNICSCKSNYFIDGISCALCPINSSTNGLIGQPICICNIIGQIIVSGVCQCPSDQFVINGSCSSVIINANNSIICIKNVQITSFDILSVTTTVTATNYIDNGYFFPTGTDSKNYFIDIIDNVYTSSVVPLFQGNPFFINVKIQIGTQTITGGTLLQENNQIQIYQMNIISKQSSVIILNSGLFNIIQSVSSLTNISNLLVNLIFDSSSAGNITLFNNNNGVINISNYLITGNYLSNQCVAMVGINFNLASVILTNITFSPIQFNVGNNSAYLITQALSSSIQIKGLVIILGNSSYSVITNSISSTLTTEYQFGGICKINNVTAQINQVIVSCNQTFTSQYVNISGILIGCALSNLNNLTIQDVCAQANLISLNQKFQMVGFIGLVYGNISFLNSQIAFQIDITYADSSGIIGLLNSVGYSEIVNLVFVFNTKVGPTSYGAMGIVGWLQSKNISYINVITANSSLNSQQQMGGITSVMYSQVRDSYALLKNTTVQNTNITVSGTSAGGLIGWCNSYYVTIVDSQIKYVNIVSTGNNGVVLGTNHAGIGLYTITNSSSTNNYLNNVLQSDCASLTDPLLPRGC